MPTGQRLVRAFDSVLRYAEFTDADLAELREIGRIMGDSFDRIVGDFYRRIVADEVTRRILEDPERIRRLMSTLRIWLDDLFRAPRDADYFKKRVAIGTTHVRVGLPFPYVFAAMSHIRSMIYETLVAKFASQPDRLAGALSVLAKALDLDLSLISGSYHEAEKYRDLVESAPEMIHTVERGGIIRDVNRTVERRLGRPRDELIGKNLASLTEGDDRDVLRRHIETVFSEGEGRCEIRLRTAGGELRHVEILSIAERDLYTREMALCRVWMRDITERRRAEADLLRERELERKYLEVAEVMMLVLDERARVRLVNRKGCEVLRAQESEIIGADWFERFIPERQRPAGRKFFERLLADETPARSDNESPIIAADGTERIIEWHHTVLTDELGAHVGTLSSGVDVTDRRRMIRELMEKDSLARLGEMAAVVAHEVRNPLAGISGAVQVIGASLAPDSQERVIVKEIVARIDALNATVNDILLFARPRLPRPIPTMMRTLMDEMLAQVRRDAAFKNLTLSAKGEDLRVKCDPELLKPVFLNLLVNAAQAMKDKGSITVSVNPVNDACRVVIHDSGPGIPEELRTKVFEPFFSTKTRGTGLGLSIARRLVEAHGGTITLACPPEGGTAVTIELPVSGPKVSESSAAIVR